METKLKLEAKEREVREGKRVLAHTQEQLGEKTAEVAHLKESYKQVRIRLLLFFIQSVHSFDFLPPSCLGWRLAKTSPTLKVIISL